MKSSDNLKGSYRPIYTSIWDDEDFRSFDNDTKVLFFNLRTTRYGNWPCIFVTYPEIMRAQTGMSDKQIEKAIATLTKAGWLSYNPPVIWIRKGLKNDPNFFPSSMKQVMGIANTLRSLPKNPLVAEFINYYQLPIVIPGMDTPIDTPLDAPIHAPTDTTDTETETKTNGPRSDAMLLMELYNVTCPSLPRCMKLTDKRKIHIKNRLKEFPMDRWGEIFGRMEKSSFCKGQNTQQWKASFDWVISSPDNPVKVLEGKYDRQKLFDIPPEPGSPDYDRWADDIERKAKAKREVQ